jgi:PAS domain S-box-containing protein
MPIWAGYAVAVGTAAAAIASRLLLNPVWSGRLPFLFFFPAIMLSGWVGGFGPALAATLLCAAAAAVFWMPPLESLTAAGASNTWGLLAFVAVGWAISAMSGSWRRAWAETRRSEERFRRAIDAAPAAVILVGSEGTVLVANELAETLFGRPRSEIVGRPAADLVSPRSRADFEARRRDSLSEPGTPSASGREIEILRKDGAEVLVEIALAAFSAESENVVMIAITDLTERKRNAALLEAAVRAREDFLSAASHELRGPVGALALHVELLRRMLPPGAEGRDVVDRAKAQVDRLARLLHDLLDESRIASGKLVLQPEEMDFREIVRQAMERFASERREYEAVVQVPAEPVTGRWDRVRTAQVVENLLSNAIKYGNGQPIAIALDAKDGSVVFSVTDQGDGIAREHQTRLFQKFERGGAAGRYDGFGLGLWIARQIVEAMHGRIAVESEPGDGSTFTVVLPLEPPTGA